MNTYTTKKGTVLPLLSLKGKDYLQVAHRILWFTEENKSFHVNVNFLTLSPTETVAQVTVRVLNEQGQAVQTAMATKRETSKDFPDHMEKAETGALGRALIQLGYGTQFALADLDEGDRLADAPLPRPDKKAANVAIDALVPGTIGTTADAEAAPAKSNVSSFRKTKKKVEEKAPAAAPTNGNGSSEDWDV